MNFNVELAGHSHVTWHAECPRMFGTSKAHHLLCGCLLPLGLILSEAAGEWGALARARRQTSTWLPWIPMTPKHPFFVLIFLDGSSGTALPPSWCGSLSREMKETKATVRPADCRALANLKNNASLIDHHGSIVSRSASVLLCVLLQAELTVRKWCFCGLKIRQIFRNPIPFLRSWACGPSRRSWTAMNGKYRPLVSISHIRHQN